ncbi:MAG TPA: XrtA/PEP-CTERM system histidine kinase PrsK [Steroidobacteraceae bacterium]|nr:XrtA/PEP-CTERM system histidine kinase PrsK [Steroidobacteraceae bacterium]
MLGYLLSAGASAVLLGACLTLWRRRLTGAGLATALAAQVAWSLASAAQEAAVPIAVGLFVAVEYLRDLAWILVLLRCLSRGGESGSARTAQRLVGALVALLIVAAVVSLTPGQGEIVATWLAHNWLWGGLLLAIAGLVLVEQVARNTRAAQRWELKYLWLGIGLTYAWDLALFSVAMLHGTAAGDFLVARGFVNVLAAGLVAVALRRIPRWESAAFLSPRIVFFNATLLGTALYVLVMSLGSYYVRQLGGTWGAAGQLLFLTAGILVLAVAVLSDQFRAWSRVTLAKHFFAYRYDYRTEWRRLTRALSEADEAPVYERIVKVMAGFMNAANGGFWLRDAQGVYVPAGGELALPDAPREAESGEFFQYLLQNEWIYDLDQARGPQGRKPAVAPPAWMLANERMWLVVPLICGGTLVGFVVIAHPLAETQLTWEEIDLLRAAGRQVASFLAFEQAAKRLAEAHQFEAMSRMSAIIMHDLRHLIAQQALVVQNAGRHRGNPEFFDDAILTIDNSVKRMTRLMDELRSGVVAEERSHRADLNEICAEAVRRCAKTAPRPSFEVRDRGIEVIVNRERLLQVLEHVIRNAQQATPQSGSVTVSLAQANQQAVLEVTDTGCGMDQQFIRDRLFRPFDSTKGEEGFGIGAYQAREFARKCGGGVEVESAPGKGTRFIIRLPLAPALVAAAGERS